MKTTRTRRIKTVLSIIALIILLTSIMPIHSLIAINSYNQEESDSAKLEKKFLKLYEKNKEFQEAVDELRGLFRGQDFDEQFWDEYTKLFNKILKKLGQQTLDELTEEELELFKQEVKSQAEDWELVELEEQYEDSVILMSDAEEIEIAEDFVPRLYQPEDDILYPALNGVWKVYVDVFDEYIYGYYLSGCYIIEISIVWFDEDHPTLDSYYDSLRLLNWGRIEDIETFFIVTKKSTEELERVSFIKCKIYRWYYASWRTIKACYSKTQTWGNQWPTHYTEKINDEDLSMYGEHPKLWVNVWNHLIGESDNNPTMDDARHDLWLWNLQHGNRKTTENEVIGSTWYTNEKLTESP